MTSNIDITSIAAAGVGGAVAGLTMGAASALVGGIGGAAGIALENVLGGAVGNAIGGQAQALVEGTKGNIAADPVTGTLNIDSESILSDAQANGFGSGEAIGGDLPIGGVLGIFSGTGSYLLETGSAGNELYLGAARYKGTLPPGIRGGISRSLDFFLEYMNQSYADDEATCE